MQSAYAAEVCSGLGVSLAVEEVLDSLEEKCRIDFCIRTSCQSTIHRFLLRRQVITLGSKFSYEVRELLSIKQKYIRNPKTFKIAVLNISVKENYKISKK